MKADLGMLRQVFETDKSDGASLFYVTIPDRTEACDIVFHFFNSRFYRSDFACVSHVSATLSGTFMPEWMEKACQGGTTE